ncbi:MAG: exodeoxyribonuclease I, partial [Alphaproteobacteria bacterium]|nr:exodeoxyribonuclease I [Alphaproteobacteria bacterium]
MSARTVSVPGLVFYDTETTGILPAFDQILQFAAIRTNSNLEELDRFEIRCRLQPHIVPAPGAMRVTQIKAGQLDDQSYPSHYEMVRRIRGKLASWSPAIFIGYNSLGFDEQILRQAFYQTLHDPYLTNRTGNARADLMRMVQVSALVAPNVLALPLNEKGQPQFKLDRLAPANGFAHERAHDALGDVEATIHLARLIRARAPDLWSASLRGGTRASAIDIMTREPMFCAFESYYAKAYGWTLTALGTSQENSASVYTYDLAIAPQELAALDEDDLALRLDQQPRPLRVIKANAGPILMDYPTAHGWTSAAAIAPAELERRAAFITSDAGFRGRLIRAYEARFAPRVSSAFVEEQIYDGFTSSRDQRLLERFHESPWEDRGQLLKELSDPRLRQLGKRLLYIERPDLLEGRTRAAQARKLAERLLCADDSVPWLTLPRALKEVKDLLATAEGAEAEHLDEHRAFLEQRLKEARRALRTRGQSV